MHHDFELLSHTADLKLRVYGTSLRQLFKNAVIGMFQSVGPQAAGCKRIGDRLSCSSLPQQRTVDVSSPDRVSLLVDFLSQALYLSDIHNEAYLDADIHDIHDTFISATLHGVKVTGFDLVELKAVTYHDLVIKQIDGIWHADIVFDI